MGRTVVIYIIFLSLSFSTYSQSKPFEGIMGFAKYTLSDTSYFYYYVRGSDIKVEEYDSQHNLLNYTLYNLDLKTRKVVNPGRQLYHSMRVKPYLTTPKDGFVIEKKENSKVINGYTCIQWLVKNKEQNTTVTYWVAIDGFHFFEDLLKLMNSTEKISTYYLHIDNTTGCLPMETAERSYLRKNRMHTEIISIEPRKLESDIFSIPENYTVLYRP